jgi:hypothetical protein
MRLQKRCERWVKSFLLCGLSLLSLTAMHVPLRGSQCYYPARDSLSTSPMNNNGPPTTECDGPSPLLTVGGDNPAIGRVGLRICRKECADSCQLPLD